MVSYWGLMVIKDHKPCPLQKKFKWYENSTCFIKDQIGNQTNLGILWKFMWAMYVLCCNYGLYYKKGDTIHPSIQILRKKERKRGL
jgi:hypothetical protein